MTGLTLAIKAMFDALSRFFSYAETSKERQSETAIIKDRDQLEKASNVAEDILCLAVKYKKYMTEKDQKQLLRLIKKFKKVN